MPRNRPALTVVELLVVIAIIGVIVILLLPMNRGSRETARRNSCRNNLKNIALALLNYESKHGTFPPAFTVDAEGNRLHSWRTLILPQMERSQLYETIDLTKPWDDPANAKAREAIVDSYMCPSADHEERLTTYLGVYGPDCIFSGSESRKLSDITDGSDETLFLIDVESDQAVHWMSPNDVNEKEILNQSRENHPGILNAAFVDGHVTALDLEIDQEVLHALLTIAGGEKIAE